MSDTMKRLSDLADYQLQAEFNVKQAESDLKSAQEKLRVVSEETLPGVMDELELKTFTTRDGLKIEIKEQIFGQITAANKAAAYAWLREHGHGSIIKPKIEVAPQDEAERKELLEQLQNVSMNFRDRSSVNYQTLGKWLREMLEEGLSLPEEITIQEKRFSKIER